MSPVICMVADRRRAGGEDGLVRRVADAARSGVDLVQIRERDLDGGPLLRLVSRCVAAVASTQARVIVNERLDVALAAEAHGVHLREDSMPAPRARTIAPPGFIVGRSVHSADGVRIETERGGLDYLIFGPVYPTASKAGHAGVGVEVLREVVRATPLPVLAIGGITRDRIAGIMHAGAAGFAAISLFDTWSGRDW